MSKKPPPVVERGPSEFGVVQRLNAHSERGERVERLTRDMEGAESPAPDDEEQFPLQ
jgi:hypothetical protein